MKELLICASLSWHTGPYFIDGRETVLYPLYWVGDPEEIDRDKKFPRGVAIAVVDIIDCRPMTMADQAAAFCPIFPGAWSWVLDNVRPVKPFEVKGQLGFFNVPDGLISFL